MAEARKISRKIGHGMGTGIPDDAESVKRAWDEIASTPWVTVDTMSTGLKIGKNTGYKLAKEGAFGAFKVGGQVRVPTALLREALHLPPAASVEQVAA